MAELTLQAKVDNLGQVMDLVEEQLTPAGCKMKTLMQVQIAVEEIFVNIAHYAYEESVGMVTIQVDVEGAPGQEQAAVITFADSGTPYNPLEREEPDLGLSVEERPVGGLGIFMVKKSVDSVEYEYRNGENVLVLRKGF